MSLQSKQGVYPFLGRMRFLGILVSILLVLCCIEGARLNSFADKVTEGQLNGSNKPAAKTILSEDGDIVDCVDIYKQPAFDHPLLRNHTIEMRPSFIPITVGDNSSLLPPQIWQKNGSCPEGTIPIQRIRETDPTRLHSQIGLDDEFVNCKVEVARVELHRYGPYIGAQGTIDAWILNVEESEWSLNSVTVFDVRDSFMESGSAVSPILFGDLYPRIFINWMDTTRDYGCFNLRCPGFVQVTNRFMLGGSLPRVSHYEGEQYDYTYIIYKDDFQQKWWMVFEGISVGYWPFELIQGFEDIPRINWGGSACNLQPNGFHTASQMGSGHFPVEGYKRSSYVRNMLVMHPDRNFGLPIFIEYSSSYIGCYRVEGCSSFPDDKGPCIYYGGPGGKCCDARCRK